jgi:hypothetical protein
MSLLLFLHRKIQAADDPDVSGLSTFDPLISKVTSEIVEDKTNYTVTGTITSNIIEVAGVGVSDIDEFKATGFVVSGDLSPLATYAQINNEIAEVTAAADSFKATGFTVPSDLTPLATYSQVNDEIESVTQSADDFKADVSNLANSLAVESIRADLASRVGDVSQSLVTASGNVSSLLSTSTEERLSKLDVTGTLANTDNADTFKSDALIDDVTVGLLSLTALQQLIQTDTTLTTANEGSVVKIAQGASGLSAADIASEILYASPSLYSAGSVGNKISTLGTGVIQVISPVTSSGVVTIIAGDDYIDSRQLSFVNSSSNWTDLTDAIINMYAAGIITATGSIVSATGASQEVLVPLTQDQTDDLTAGVYDYQVQATWPSGKKETLVYGERQFVVRKQ